MKKKNIILSIMMILTILLLISGCNGGSNKKASIQQYSNTDFVMDTVLNMTFYSEKDASAEIKALLEDLETEELSWRIADSTIYKINEQCAAGQSVEMDDRFGEWTEKCLDLSEQSQGAFDPTIGKLTRLWNIEGEHPVVPKQEEIDACLSDIGYENIKIEDKKISMGPGTSLDLGAVGKGIACDVVSSYIKEHQEMNTIQGAVVAVGGSIVVLGAKPDGSDWNVAVQDPDQDDGVPMGVISLQGENYISTSGDYEKYFEEKGKRYHHILDPHTGYPSESGLRSVTIVCKNGLLSDGLSTACFVLGKDKGMELAKKYNAEAVFISNDNEVFVSDGLKDSFTLVENTYKYEK